MGRESLTARAKRQVLKTTKDPAKGIRCGAKVKNSVGPRSGPPALFDCTVRAGFGQHSRLHAVGDGAEWIANQVEDQFDTNGYL